METREQNVPLNETPENGVSPEDSLHPAEEVTDEATWKPTPPITRTAIRVNPVQTSDSHDDNPFIEGNASPESAEAPHSPPPVAEQPIITPVVAKEGDQKPTTKTAAVIVGPAAVKSTVSVKSDTPAVTRRKPILTDDLTAPVTALVEQSGKQPTSYMVNAPKPANQRRSKHVVNFIILLFFLNLLAVAAFGIWFYNTIIAQVDSRLRGAPNLPLAQTISAGSETTQAQSSQNQQEISRLNEQLADLQSQIQAAQKRLDNSEQANQKLTAQLQEKNGAPAAVPVATPVSAVPVASGSASPTDAELILLKERNRLTSFADEAIATGARAPYVNLWKALDDKRLSNLVHAARAEILRVQNYYLSGSRLESFDIPVAEYYPDSANLRDSQLDDGKLIDLMHNQNNPWQVRLKAANLLGLRRSTAVGDALVETIKNDNNLDVVKEATFSFEQITGYRARLFESEPLAQWWAEYNAPASPQEKTAAPKPPAPTPAPEPAKEQPKKAKAEEAKPQAPAEKPAEKADQEDKKQEAPPSPPKEEDKQAPAAPAEAAKPKETPEQGAQPELKLPELRIPDENPTAE